MWVWARRDSLRRCWSDILDPSTAKVLATYGKSYYAGKPAVTMNNFGKGHVYYVGTESKSPLFYDRLIALAARTSAVALNDKIPAGVEVSVRQKGGKPIVFIMNYTGTAQTVPLDRSYKNALTGTTEPMDVEIPAYDVKVLTEE